MSQHPASGAPDYFALFQLMFSPAAAPAASAAQNMFALLDPKELDKKISEMETVLAWLQGTVNVVDMSLQAMQYQKSLLASITQSTVPAAHAKSDAPVDPEQFAQMASAMNPALWAMQMMQQPTAARPAKAPVKRKAAPRKKKKL